MSKPKVLDRAGLLALASDLPRQRVELEGLGAVFVRMLTAAERSRFEVDYNARTPEDRRATMLQRFTAIFACDETGARLFADDDVDALGNLPGPALEAVVEAGLRLNKWLPGDAPAAGKNS